MYTASASNSLRFNLAGIRTMTSSGASASSSLSFDDLLSQMNVFKSSDEVEPNEIVEQLSDNSKAVLTNLKAGRNVSAEAWTDLMRELKDMGEISETEFAYCRLDCRLIPLGEIKNGVTVTYPQTNSLRETLKRFDDVAENPLELLQSWAFALCNWKDVLSMEKDDNGLPKYQELSNLEKEAASCNRVVRLVKELMA